MFDKNGNTADNIRGLRSKGDGVPPKRRDWLMTPTKTVALAGIRAASKDAPARAHLEKISGRRRERSARVTSHGT